MSAIRSVSLALAVLAPGALANLQINNWCGAGASIVYSHAGGCDSGANGQCITDGDVPYQLAPGTGQSILNMPYIADGVGTSVKISKDDVPDGILQFEYNVVQGEFGGLYWDLSDLDGVGAGLVGTPYGDQNVMVTPTGNGVGAGTCVVIHCAANQVCLDSYQHPDDTNTKVCPLDTGDLWLDLCAPPDLFGQATRKLPLAQKNKAGFKHLVGDSVYDLHKPNGTEAEHQQRALPVAFKA